jgi:TolB protein
MLVLRYRKEKPIYTQVKEDFGNMAEQVDKNNPWYRDKDESILEIYDVTTGERSVLKEFDYLIEAPGWTPDGKELVFNSNGGIYRYDIATGKIQKVDTQYCNACNNDHVVSSDGKWVGVSHHAAEDHQSRVYIVPLEGGVPRLLTPLAPSYLHGWSPDGRTLAYCAQRNGEFDIYTIDANGGVEKQLTDAPGLNDGPEYDSQGEYIWFNSVRSGLMQAFRMKADGTEQTQMTFDDGWNTWFPHISPDCKKVSMICYKKGDVRPDEHVPHKNVEIRVMNADGGNLHTVAAVFGGQGTLNVNSWSPDSTQFAFVSYRIREE